MAKAPKKVETSDIEIIDIHTKEVRFNILGASPMIMHRFAQKAWRELLLPAPQKNRAEKATTLKHDPIAEFRGAIYMSRETDSPTAIHIPCGAFHKAVGQAAIDIPGAAKAEIMRLTSVVTPTIHLYGIPVIGCDMVRNSGINGAPDVRIRPYFREWACQLSFRYVSDLVTERQIASLLGAAGHIVGIGDWRGQKGGPYGRFKIVPDSDADFKRIVEHQGRKAQLEAIEHPQHFDEDAEELIGWFFEEVERREKEATLSGSTDQPKGRRKPQLVAAE
jgi:hypothetical protein